MNRREQDETHGPWERTAEALGGTYKRDEDGDGGVLFVADYRPGIARDFRAEAKALSDEQLQSEYDRVVAEFRASGHVGPALPYVQRMSPRDKAIVLEHIRLIPADDPWWSEEIEIGP